MQTKQFSPHKTIARSAEDTTRNLTQPTDLAEDWAGTYYTNPDIYALVGFIGAFSVKQAGS